MSSGYEKRRHQALPGAISSSALTTVAVACAFKCPPPYQEAAVALATFGAAFLSWRLNTFFNSLVIRRARSDWQKERRREITECKDLISELKETEAVMAEPDMSRLYRSSISEAKRRLHLAQIAKYPDTPWEASELPEPLPELETT